MLNTTTIHKEGVDTLGQSEDFSDYLGVLGGMVNPDDVDKTLRWLTHPGETFEISTFDSQRKPYAGTCCGYFRDVGPAVKAVVNHIEHFEPAQVYVTLNPVLPDLYARAKDRIKERQKNTTKDADIVGYRNILVDLDPVRPSGVPSSEPELEEANKRMIAVRGWLKERGFPDPLTAMSGNGYHLIYAVDLDVGDESKRLIKRFLGGSGITVQRPGHRDRQVSPQPGAHQQAVRHTASQRGWSRWAREAAGQHHRLPPQSGGHSGRTPICHHGDTSRPTGPC